MATLTTEWKSYDTAEYKASAGAKLTFYLEARYSSQDVSKNTTKIYTRLRSTITGGTIRGAGYNFTCSYCTARTGTTVWTFENEVIISSPETTITHNTDGTKNITLNATAKNTYWSINKSLSATVTLPKINRIATATSADNFNDEGNTTISFNNPAGFTAKPYINFYDNSNTLVYQLYRDISATSPYTWNITNEERTAIRNACNTQKTYTVWMGVDTYNGSTKLGASSLGRTFSIINANPTLSLSIVETNQKVVSLIGSSANYWIENASQLKVTGTATPLKGANITSVYFRTWASGETNKKEYTDTTSPYEYTFSPVSSWIGANAYDSRGNVSSYADIQKTFISYQPVNINSVSFTRRGPTSSEIILNSQIRYYQKTFGSVANVPVIKWKIGSGNWTTLTSSQYTLDATNNLIKINGLSLGEILPYTQQGTLYLQVDDKLSTSSQNKLVTKGRPTFSAGEFDILVEGGTYNEPYISTTNGTYQVDLLIGSGGSNRGIYDVGKGWMMYKDASDQVYVGGYAFAKQNVLWQGASFMNANQRIDLTDTPISSQPHGIVLVFSAYESGSAKNWDFVTRFIPKEVATGYSGFGHDIMLHTSTFSMVGAKYVYISDTEIIGGANNEAVGTGTSGIKYTNNHWVLRAVIGV